MGKTDDGKVLWMLLPVLLCYFWVGCFVWGAFAQDETLFADADDDVNMDPGVLSLTGGTCGSTCDNGVACYAHLDEGYGSEDDALVGGITDEAWAYFKMDLPANDPSTATDAQTLNITTSETNESCVEEFQNVIDPVWRIFLYCNGSDQGIIWGPGEIEGVDTQTSFTWTFPGAPNCEVDGSDVEFAWAVDEEISKQGKSFFNAMENLEWDVTWESVAGRRR